MDLALFKLLNGVPHPEWLNAVFWCVTSLGLGHVQAILLLLGAFVARNRLYSEKALWPGLWSLLLSGTIVVQSLKRLVERARPPGPKPPDEMIYAYSFPSGHSATSFALAYVLWRATRGTRHANWGRAAWVFAALIGYSRIYRGVHYPGDVAAGAIIGIASAWVVCRFFERRYQSASGISE